MIHVTRTMLVARPIEDAVVYFADFAHTEEWDPATVSCVRLDPGPVEPGARWRNLSRFRGRTSALEYRLDARQADHLVFTGENGTVRVKDDLRFTPASDGSTRLTYDATFAFKGVARLAAPFLRKEVDRLADDVAAAVPRATAR
ncbi:SRPBCC family protein [Streptomyces lavendulae]|uniref:SRPBCC family protein n=1 Tax=Streptomyces lavendulae TaxID=1914 RepID=UPI0024A45A80|nr:SRPBCC family protein [Streptomyces lavendulae]GLX23194.1 polyketide cyclase [Streptomyces lavendulae subsp. lavendulae]GLX30656.1 polyketide cyclase [Streptomyces lavendulae subsp. lavendulae]